MCDVSSSVLVPVTTAVDLEKWHSFRGTPGSEHVADSGAIVGDADHWQPCHVVLLLFSDHVVRVHRLSVLE
jgi:hypothetical protein